MGILLALIKKEFIQTFRDHRLRIVIFVMPVIQMTLFGFAISSEVKNVPITVCDQDGSSSSRELVSALTRGDYFRVVQFTRDSREAVRDLEVNRAKISVIIPPDFQEKILKGEDSPFQLLVDGSDGNSASIASGYILRIMRETSLSRAVPVISGSQLAGVVPPSRPSFEPEIRVLYNPEMESRFFLIPGIITMLITLIVSLLTAMGITREKEAGTFEQLIVSPIQGWQLILGKTLPFLVIGAMDVVLVVVVGKLIFGMPFNGDPFAFAVLNLTYVFAILGLGLFISSISKTQQQAMMTVFAVLYPFIILSDFFFPIENMPVAIQYLTIINPMKYSLVAQREIMLKGSGWEQVGSNILVLAGFAVAFIAYGVFRFRKSLAS